MLQQEGTSGAQLYFIYAVELEGDSKEEVVAGEHLIPAAGSTLHSLTEVHSQDPLHLLLIEFEDIFAKPTTLPPNRSFDHSPKAKFRTCQH